MVFITFCFFLWCTWSFIIISLVFITVCVFLWYSWSFSVYNFCGSHCILLFSVEMFELFYNFFDIYLFCFFWGDCVQILYCFLYSAFCCLVYLQLFNWKFFDTFFRLESVQALLSIELLGVSQSGWTDLEYTKLCMMKHDTFHLYVLNRLFLSFLTNQDAQVQLMSIFLSFHLII